MWVWNQALCRVAEEGGDNTFSVKLFEGYTQLLNPATVSGKQP